MCTPWNLKLDALAIHSPGRHSQSSVNSMTFSECTECRAEDSAVWKVDDEAEGCGETGIQQQEVTGCPMSRTTSDSLSRTMV